MKIGFIGTGIMGAPMAHHLQSAGHELALVQHRSQPPAELLKNGAVAYSSCEEVAKHSDVVILMVPDTADVEMVLYQEAGVIAGLSAGKIVIDMSSIDPIATKKFAADVVAKGCEYVDAPVSGGEVGAKAASLTIMVGAEASTFAKVKPLFEVMGKNITLIGPVGSGQTAKVANQIIVALTIGAVSEALVFAKKAGADPARVREALMGGFASSKILEVHGERMLKRTFDPGFKIRLHQKDLALALNGAKALGLALPCTAQAQQLFSGCVAQGGEDWDHSAMIKIVEIMAGI